MNILSSDSHPVVTKFLGQVSNVFWKFVPENEFLGVLKSDEVKNFDLILYQNIELFLLSQNINIPKILFCMNLPEDKNTINLNKLISDPNLKSIIFISPQQIFDWKIVLNSKIKLISWVINADEYPEWKGGKEEIISICNLLKQRDKFCGYFVWENCTVNLPRKLIGFGNEEIGKEEEGIIGFKTPEEIKKILVSSNVFFNQTTKSTTPTSLLEAMAIGIPIVSYESYFANQVIGYRGYVDNNIANLRSSLEQLIYKTPEKYIEYGQKNRILVKELFSPELWIYNWEKILRNV